MKKLLCVSSTLMLFALFISCGAQPDSHSESGASKSVAAEANSDEERTALVLSQILDDFRGFYFSFYMKATAEDQYFEDTQVILVQRKDEADTVEYITKIEKTSDNSLAELCTDIVAMYGAINSFTYGAERKLYTDMCGRLYDLIGRIADQLGEPFPADVLPLSEPSSKPSSKPDTSVEPSASSDSNSKKIPDSRWDGDNASGAMNGYSIVFYNDRAYFGITYEDDEFIISNGLELTYTISGNKLTLNSVSDSRSVVMTYDGTTITDNPDKNKCAFEPGYVFRKQ